MKSMRTGTKLEYRQRIEMAIEFILENLDSPPTAVEVADYAGFSRHHFGRVFSMAVGEPIAEFARRLRLERAAWSLDQTEKSITEIAFEAGYESHEGFSRAFREWYHVAPSEFRSRSSRHEIQVQCQVHWFPAGRRSVPVLIMQDETNMEARIEHLDDIHVVALRHQGPYYQIGEKFGQLSQWAGRHQVPMNMGVAIYYDNPDEVAAYDLRSEACMMVGNGFALPETDGLDLRILTIQGGDHAMFTHMGPYDGIGDAWAMFFGQALPKLGRECAEGPTFEIYRNDCRVVKPEELRTDLYIRLK